MSPTSDPDLPKTSFQESEPDYHQPAVQRSLAAYWRKNLQLMGVLLVIWLMAGLGCGVLFADSLNQYRLFGYPLGFWFAQQGSIIVFVLLILAYCLFMNKLDVKHHEELTRIGEGE